MKKLSLILLTIGLAATLASQAAAQIRVDPRTKPIDGRNTNPKEAEATLNSQFIAKYVDKLDARLKGKSVGYTFYVTYKNGLAQGRAGGDARRAPDPNPRKMTIDDKFNIASVSKIITAAAVMKLLYTKRIRVDDPVYPYLPPKWKLGGNFKSITFRELLTHRSGVRCPGEVTYALLKKCVADGIDPADKLKDCKGLKNGKICYNNSNFALFRFIIPRLHGFDGGTTGEDPISEVIASATYSTLYTDYVRKNVLEPAGLMGVDCHPIKTNPALSYQFPGPIGPGADWGNTTETCGSQGWNLNVKQLTAFMVALSSTEKIVPVTVFNKMKEGQFGMNRNTSIPGITTYDHNGYYCCELNSLLINFSNGMNVALIINSQYGPGLFPANEVRAAMVDALK